MGDGYGEFAEWFRNTVASEIKEGRIEDGETLDLPLISHDGLSPENLRTFCPFWPCGWYLDYSAMASVLRADEVELRLKEHMDSMHEGWTLEELQSVAEFVLPRTE
jgi:hypothetical protein